MIPNKGLGFINKITEVIPIKHWVICQGITKINRIDNQTKMHGYLAQEGARTTHSKMNQLKLQVHSFTIRRKVYILIIREKCIDK